MQGISELGRDGRLAQSLNLWRVSSIIVHQPMGRGVETSPMEKARRPRVSRAAPSFAAGGIKPSTACPTWVTPNPEATGGWDEHERHHDTENDRCACRRGVARRLRWRGRRDQLLRINPAPHLHTLADAHPDTNTDSNANVSSGKCGIRRLQGGGRHEGASRLCEEPRRKRRDHRRHRHRD